MASNKLTGRIEKVIGQTATVIVDRKKRDPIYHKIIKKQKRFIVECSGFDLSPDGQVEIVECRPISKKKRWKVNRIIK